MPVDDLRQLHPGSSEITSSPTLSSWGVCCASDILSTGFHISAEIYIYIYISVYEGPLHRSESYSLVQADTLISIFLSQHSHSILVNTQSSHAPNELSGGSNNTCVYNIVGTMSKFNFRVNGSRNYITDLHPATAGF